MAASEGLNSKVTKSSGGETAILQFLYVLAGGIVTEMIFRSHDGWFRVFVIALIAAMLRYLLSAFWPGKQS